MKISSGENSDTNTDEEVENVDDGGNDQRQPYMLEEANPFTENIRHAKLPRKTHIPDNVQPITEANTPWTTS